MPPAPCPHPPPSSFSFSFSAFPSLCAFAFVGLSVLGSPLRESIPTTGDGGGTGGRTPTHHKRQHQRRNTKPSITETKTETGRKYTKHIQIDIMKCMQAPLPPPPSATSSYSNPMHSNASSAGPPSVLPQAPPVAPAGTGSTGGGHGRGGGYHRVPLKMPAGSNLSSKGPVVPFGNPAMLTTSSSGLGSGRGGNGVLTRNLSPEKNRRPPSGGAAVRGGGGEDRGVEMMKGGLGVDVGTFRSMSGVGSIASSDNYDVEDAKQRITAPRVRTRVCRRQVCVCGMCVCMCACLRLCVCVVCVFVQVFASVCLCVRDGVDYCCRCFLLPLSWHATKPAHPLLSNKA